MASTPCDTAPQSPVCPPPPHRSSPRPSLDSSPDTMDNQDRARASVDENQFVCQSFADIGKKQKQFIDVLATLHQIDISNVAELPELVIMGDQSAGKSSLMSALAGISLPRSGGVCTRCPFHFRFSASDEPQALTVSLYKDYTYESPPPGTVISRRRVTAQNQFYPWVKKPQREIKPFMTVRDNTNYDDVFRWAQVAILNPSKNSEQFVPDGTGLTVGHTSLSEAIETTEAQFSPNIIAVEIKGPNLPDISFYDLPGVFCSPGDPKDDYIVKVVENLTRLYLKRERATILWALPMSSDPELSISYALIRKTRATDRTAGVITKADLLPPGIDNVSQWQPILGSQKYQLGHGYFVTARGPKRELDDEWERSFFRGENESTWPKELQSAQHRTGVQLLTKFVTELLANDFQKKLPSIKYKIDIQLDNLEEQLRALPELASNPEHEIRQALKEFFLSTKRGIDDDRFKAHWSQATKDFKESIRRLKPTVDMTITSGKRNNTTSIVDVESAITINDSEDDKPDPTPSKSTASSLKRKQPLSGTSAEPSPPFKKRESNARAAQTRFGEKPLLFTPVTERFGTPGQEREVGTPLGIFKHEKLSLAGVRREMGDMAKPGVPDSVELKVHEALALRSIQRWKGPFEAYIATTTALLDTMFKQVLEHSLRGMRERQIFRSALSYLEEFGEQKSREQQADLRKLYEAETYALYTINDETFKRNRSEEYDAIVRVRTMKRLESVNLVAPGELDWDNASDQRRLNELKGRLGPDPFDREIDVASYVRGYYRTAADRFVDNAGMLINSCLFKSVRDQSLDDFMEEKLGLRNSPDSDVFDGLMEEDVRAADKRRALKKEKENLLHAKAKIESLPLWNDAAAERFRYGTPYEDSEAESSADDVGV